MSDCLEKLLALLESSGPRLHALLVRLTLREDVAEDLMQELFLKLRQSKGFERAGNPNAYACRAAINLAFDWRRSRHRGSPLESIVTEPTANTLPALDKLIKGEEFERILNALGELPSVSREVVVMRYLQQESYETIAEHLGKSPHQVRALCHKAITRLRSVVDKPLSSPRKGISRADT